MSNVIGGNGNGIRIVNSLEGCTLKDDGLVIEIFGPPKSGKSWQIKQLIERLQADPTFKDLRPNFNYRVFKFSVKDELSKEDRYAFHMCYVTSHHHYLNRIRRKRKHSDVPLEELDLVISDRGPTDDNSFAHTWFELGKMTDDERDRALLLSNEAEGWVNASILMYVPPEEALRREDEQTLEVVGHKRRGEVMNEPTLRQLCGFYELARLGERYRIVNSFTGKRQEVKLAQRPPIFVDGEKGSKEDNAAYIYDEVFKLFVPTTSEYYRSNGDRPHNYHYQVQPARA